MLAPEKMTVSGLERYVRIVETVHQSDAMLSQGDRMGLINDMLDEPGNPSVEQIERRCKELEDRTAGDNMINAMIIRDARRGY